uniref:ADP-ribosylhydrolase ARH3 n=1 Tax=Ditylenchus dipsaci TaxID=166011 RepID=A0A915E8X8_9BILA
MDWRQDLEESRKQELYERIRFQAQQNNQESLSNGMLMRVSPLAVAYRNMDTEQLRILAEEDCKLTHCNPIVLNAVFGGSVQRSPGACKPPLIYKILQEAQEKPSPVLSPDGCTIKGDQKSMGYFGVSLQGAFYQLLHADNFSTGLEEVISRGGDTDTNGCIAASLLGAYFGADAIPQQWIEDVKKAPPGTGGSTLYGLEDAEELINGLATIISVF